MDGLQGKIVSAKIDRSAAWRDGRTGESSRRREEAGVAPKPVIVGALPTQVAWSAPPALSPGSLERVGSCPARLDDFARRASGRFARGRYRQKSHRILEIITSTEAVIESTTIDEGFLDLSTSWLYFWDYMNADIVD